jgi:hypothetical protein
MKIKLTLATATAIGLMMGTAWGGGDNTLFIEQNGEGNTAKIQQAASSNNDIGLAGAPVLQQGNYNDFQEIQPPVGPGNNNDIVAARQMGNSNKIYSINSNGAANNTIHSVLQNGDKNRLSVSRNNQRSGTIGTVIQGGYSGDPVGGNANRISINQVTYNLPGSKPEFTGGNSVDLVSQIGSGNTGYGSSGFGTQISQGGSLNRIMESSVVGNDNAENNNYGRQFVHRISQKGIGNGQVNSTAITLGSNGNSIDVMQDGDANNFDVRQGADVTSTQNHAKVTQTGDNNLTIATQYGSFNTLDARQNGDGNTISALVTGDSNGSSLFDDAGARGLAEAHSLSSGDIFQNRQDNRVGLTITSSSNQFAFLQTGGNGNLITGTITGAGSNQAVGVQNGSSNTASLNQAGGNNVAVFQQVGSGNTGTFGQ